MFDALLYAFNPANFEAHGVHFLNTPVLFWLLVIGNALTALSYILIPIVLVYFVKKRKDLVFHGVFLLFGAFIVLCGLHHFVHIITFWYPLYGIQALVDVSMAIVSFATFLAMIPVVPAALKLPSPQALTDANERLSKEVENHKKTEEVLTQSHRDLMAKNTELEKVNKLMIDRELKMIELKKEIERLKHE